MSDYAFNFQNFTKKEIKIDVSACKDSFGKKDESWKKNWYFSTSISELSTFRQKRKNKNCYIIPVISLFCLIVKPNLAQFIIMGKKYIEKANVS